jgi:hypothetical protein
MRVRWVVPVVAALLLTSCNDLVARIESDTSWTATVEGNVVTGRGNEQFTLNGRNNRCVTVQKTTEAGTVRLIIEQGTFFGLGSMVDFEGTTTTAFGSVSGCAI